MRKMMVWLSLLALLLTGCGQGRVTVPGTDPGQSVPTTAPTDTVTQPPETTEPAASEIMPAAENGAQYYRLEQVLFQGSATEAQDGFLVLEEGGTGWINTLGEEQSLQWTEETITINGESASYTLEGEVLTLTAGELEMVFRRSGDSAPSRSYTAAKLADQEATQWYGWWMMYNCQGDWADYENAWWDCAAELEGQWSDGITMRIWDEETSRQEPLGTVPLILTGDETAASGEGTFMEAPLAVGQWSVEYDGNSLYIYGTMPGEYEYYIFLRPWGLRWTDLELASQEDLPYYYYDWYLPLIEAGEALPDTIALGIGAQNQCSLDPEGMLTLDYDPTVFTYVQEWYYFKNLEDGSTVTVTLHTELPQLPEGEGMALLLEHHEARRFLSVNDAGYYQAVYVITFDEPVGDYVGCTLTLNTFSTTKPQPTMNQVEAMIPTIRAK